MGSSQEDITDDEFDLTEHTNEDPTLVLQRLKEFTFYLVENIEFNLDFCLKLLEERTVPAKPNSMHVTALSMLCSVVPKVGGGLGSLLKQGEVTVFRKIEKKNSRLLADLVYYFSDNKIEFRDIIIEAAAEIFASFEYKFMELTCKGGEKRAMMKLAVDASDRIFNHFLSTEQKRDVTKNEIIKGVLYGDSKRNRGGKKEGKSVTKNDNEEKEIKLKTCKLYSKSGIFIPTRNLFYKNDYTKTEKYGYRKIFSWEDESDIMKTWTLDECQKMPVYLLEITDDLLQCVKEYVMSKDRHEEAKLERAKYSDESMTDRQQKHEEALKTLKECYNKILTGLESLEQQILDTIRENAIAIIAKLDTVHDNVLETNENQKELLRTNENIQNHIVEIKHHQEELAIATLKHEEISNLLDTKIKEGAKDGVKEFVSEALRQNDPGPRIKKEVERTIDKGNEELKRFEKRIRKLW